MKAVYLFYHLLFSVYVYFVNCKPPNIVFILTDDQDVNEGGSGIPIKKINELIGEQGIVFKNSFVSSPLCCPSRSSLFTGKYLHNHHAINNSVSGQCSSYQWQKEEEPNTFPVYLKKQGYTTFFAGKYLNQYGFKKTGGPSHIPPGWDWWNGLIGNSRYYGYSISVNGTMVSHDHDYKTDYYTDVIHRSGMDFLKLQDENSDPFFMMLSTPACHGPFTPAPQYSDVFSDLQAPRDPIFNTHGILKHWLIEHAITPMTNDTVTTIDNIFRNRWRTLLSVDDMVEDVMNTLQSKNLLGNTYVVFSSDNGYHLGQFSMPEDKRQLYEFDIRVPLMIRGPGITPGQVLDNMVINIDLAPTFIEIAGATPGPQMDGLSLLPLLKNGGGKNNLNRTAILIEHTGESAEEVKGCPQYTGQRMGNCNPDCVCEDSWNNTYNCARIMSDTLNYKYCHLLDLDNFVEVYNLDADVWEIVNTIYSIPPKLLQQLKSRLSDLVQCSGQTCHLT
ncbi:N-acetylglucosamine-6-sulfatase [Patella vulgata]|uniref:N-acetylglucosamine-6-sulfatase n=1 Tax=Patella vulgata TaxID=6465 RepID=UPI00217FBD0F|nr:N-acetylglucosamine-6-sulfatase [Patella vulgata]